MERSTWSARRWRVLLVVLAVLGAHACTSRPVIPNWDPAAFRDLDTLELLTVGPQEGKHWSTVWLVVLDDRVYVRLGSRAADRMRRNATAPWVGVRIGGREYEDVRVAEAAAMTGRVAAAMGEKYWSDVLVRYVPHSLTLRLERDTGADEH